MRVLITGGTGFVGTALTTALLQQGLEVYYLTTSTKKIANQANHKGFLWNVAQQTIDTACFEGVEVVVNLAGKTINAKWNEKNKKEILESRIQASHLLYKTLSTIQHNVKHVISASAVGIYASDFNALYTEKEPFVNPEFLGQVCRMWEAHNNKFKELGIRTTILRFGLILSKNEGALPKFTQLIKLNLGSNLGSGKQWYSWIHYQDVVNMIQYTMTAELGGVYNCVAPQPLRQNDFLNGIAKHLHRVNWLPRVPSFLLKIALGEKYQLVTDSQKVSSKKIETTGFEFQYPSLKQALAALYPKN